MTNLRNWLGMTTWASTRAGTWWWWCPGPPLSTPSPPSPWSTPSPARWDQLPCLESGDLMMAGAGAGPRHPAPPRGAGVTSSPAQPRPEHPVVARQHPATQVYLQYLNIYNIYNIYIDIYIYTLLSDCRPARCSTAPTTRSTPPSPRPRPSSTPSPTAGSSWEGGSGEYRIVQNSTQYSTVQYSTQ